MPFDGTFIQESWYNTSTVSNLGMAHAQASGVQHPKNIPTSPSDLTNTLKSLDHAKPFALSYLRPGNTERDTQNHFVTILSDGNNIVLHDSAGKPFEDYEIELIGKACPGKQLCYLNSKGKPLPIEQTAEHTLLRTQNAGDRNNCGPLSAELKRRFMFGEPLVIGDGVNGATEEQTNEVRAQQADTLKNQIPAEAVSQDAAEAEKASIVSKKRAQTLANGIFKALVYDPSRKGQKRNKDGDYFRVGAELAEAVGDAFAEFFTGKNVSGKAAPARKAGAQPTSLAPVAPKPADPMAELVANSGVRLDGVSAAPASVPEGPSFAKAEEARRAASPSKGDSPSK